MVRFQDELDLLQSFAALIRIANEFLLSCEKLIGGCGSVTVVWHSGGKGSMR